MIADLGTRQVDDLRLVDQNSTWVNGFDWMRKDNKEFLIKSFGQIRFSREELAELRMCSNTTWVLQVFKAVIKTTSTW